MIVGKTGEFRLIDTLVGALGAKRGRAVRGPGDDAAVVEVEGGRLLLVTCDAQIEGIHFSWETFSPEQVGQKAAAVNLSDIAAMGGKPTFAVVSLAAPASLEVDVLERVYSGLSKTFGRWDVEVVGGNTAELPERTVLDITLLGEVAPANMLLRKGARQGDAVCVTGMLGASAAGLELLKKPELLVDEPLRVAALAAHRTPVPRILEGAYLGRSGRVSSCIDLSDGLLGDAAHIAQQSNAAIRVILDRVPVSPSAQAVAQAMSIDPVELAATRGEDFELLFTVGLSDADEIIHGLERETGTRAVAIGEVVDGPPGIVAEKNGKLFKIDKTGFDHFGQ